MPSAMLFALALAAQLADAGAMVDPLVVVAPASKEARGFVHSVMAPAGHRLTGQIARWDDPICPIVIGATSEASAAVVGRIRDVAADVGAPLAGRRCRANIAVVVTDRPRQFLAAFASKRRFSFFGHTDRGALKRYLESDRPVRWWHTSHVGPARSEGPALDTPLDGPPQMRLIDSRVESNVQTSFTRALIVIDSTKVRGFGIDPVADYAAMVTLAQIDARAGVQSAPTILNLFDAAPDDSHRSDALTSLDVALLKALYQAKPNVSFARQRQQIVHSIPGARGKVPPP